MKTNVFTFILRIRSCLLLAPVPIEGLSQSLCLLNLKISVQMTLKVQLLQGEKMSYTKTDSFRVTELIFSFPV